MLDAEARVRGTVSYAINLRLPGMLICKVLRSPIAHGRVIHLDTSPAEQLPGVVAVMSSIDFDRPGAPSLNYGVAIKDQPLLASDRVRYVGEPIALVAAEDLQTAEEALARIKAEYQEEPAVYDPLLAMGARTQSLHEDHPDNCFLHAKLRHGLVEAEFERADFILEETYSSPVAQQASLEPHVAIAQWEDGHLAVWTAAQAPYLVQRVLADVFGMHPEQVRVIVPTLGGGYGGKGHVRIEPLVAALALKTSGRPVKLVLSRDEEFVTVTKHAATIKIKTGVSREGIFTAREVTLHWGAGAYADASPGLIRSGMVRSVGPYRFQAVKVDSFGIYTNLPPAAAYRGAMSSQTTWAYESHTDSIAHRLGLDPLELRRRNLLRSGERFCTGETMHDVHFEQCLEAAAAGLGWDSPKVAGLGTTRRGRGLAVMMKSTIPRSRSECRLAIDAAGHLTLYTSTVEMGQGAHTALAQIASEAIGLPLDRVRVVGPDTQVTPYDTTTSASRSSGMMGMAILDAAGSLRSQLARAAAAVFEVAPEELDLVKGEALYAGDPLQHMSYGEVLQRNGLQTMEAAGAYQTDAGLDPETGQGVASPHWHQGAGACEVEVDTETGKVTVLRYFSSAYAGRVINPALARMQNDGNVIFGLGPALSEQMVFDHGQVTNANLSDYMLPSFLDIPTELNSALLETEGAEIHGIGEMTLPPVAPAIANAIFDAVGVRVRELPVTAEKVLRALMDRGPHG